MMKLMETDSSLIAGISFISLVSGEIWMFHEVTKIIHRFCSAKHILLSVDISFLFTVFLVFTLYAILRK